MPFDTAGMTANILQILEPTEDYHAFESGIAAAIVSACSGLIYGAGQLVYTYSYAESEYTELFYAPAATPDALGTFKTQSVPEFAQVLADLFTAYFAGTPLPAPGVGVGSQAFDPSGIAAANAAVFSGLVSSLSSNASLASDRPSIAAAMASSFAAGAILITTSHIHTDPVPPVPYPNTPAA